MTAITGRDLIDWGLTPSPEFSAMLTAANRLQDLGHPPEAIKVAVAAMVRVPPPTRPLHRPGIRWSSYLDINGEADNDANVLAVARTMDLIMQTPVVTAGAVMPDACPAGPVGTIPVGGVVVSEGIHPGMHSADICCSMFMTVYEEGTNWESVLQRISAGTHFGPGGRGTFAPSPRLAAMIEDNPVTKPLLAIAAKHMGTQGDGNHFAYVGRRASDGRIALVTHHGSRGFGAQVYKAGMKLAEAYRKQVSPETLPQNAWIDADTKDGEAYWGALQIVREWTRENHTVIHSMVEDPFVDRFWNEHNFVFRKSDGLFYHAKGATPTGWAWADDATEHSIIPLNMAEPILIVDGLTAQPQGAHGFSPHGAGRNMSRTAHIRRLAERYGDARGLSPDAHARIVADETAGLDVRFHCGIPDVSELPSAYKSAAQVRREIDRYDLAREVDQIMPLGCIMAGDVEFNAPWRRR